MESEEDGTRVRTDYPQSVIEKQQVLIVVYLHIDGIRFVADTFLVLNGGYHFSQC